MMESRASAAGASVSHKGKQIKESDTEMIKCNDRLSMVLKPKYFSVA